MRGEHTSCCGDNMPYVGSSPHARGARADAWPQAGGGRIIPACAGSTTFRASVILPSRDHPRMRGEHLYSRYKLECPGGSSPHARGAPS